MSYTPSPEQLAAIAELDDADRELSAAIRPATFELVTGGLPLLAGLLALVGMIRRRRQLRRLRDGLVAELGQEAKAPGAEPNRLAVPTACADFEPRGGAELDPSGFPVNAPDELAEQILRIKLALPDWARLEQDPASGRWLVLDAERAPDRDDPDPAVALIGAPIVSVLVAPAEASRMTDVDLAGWADRLDATRNRG